MVRRRDGPLPLPRATPDDTFSRGSAQWPAVVVKSHNGSGKSYADDVKANNGTGKSRADGVLSNDDSGMSYADGVKANKGGAEASVGGPMSSDGGAKACLGVALFSGCAARVHPSVVVACDHDALGNPSRACSGSSSSSERTNLRFGNTATLVARERHGRTREQHPSRRILEDERPLRRCGYGAGGWEHPAGVQMGALTLGQA